MEKDITRVIGYFYFERENENEDVACEAIRDLQIHKIEYTDGVVIITLSRPGFLIGKKGENIIRLTEYLKKEFKDMKEIKIIEDNILCHLYDFDLRYYYNEFK